MAKVRHAPPERKVISLFSGAGGLDIGFARAGFKTAVMVELDPSCCKTLRKNLPDIPLIEGDLNQVPTQRILETGGLRPLEAALVIGGPPCQSFSLAGDRMGLDDPRGRLVLEFIRVVREALPVGFVMENVRGLENWKGGRAVQAIFNEIAAPIEYQGKRYQYKVVKKVLNAADYGCPQFRERIFIVGNRINVDFEYPQPTHYAKPKKGQKKYVSAGKAILGLPRATPPSETALRVSGTIKARREKHGY